jgi:hypothetical protein
MSSRDAWAAVSARPRGPAEAEARLVLHHAVQLVAAVGQHLAARRPDDSQQSLTVDGGLWLGEPVAGELRAGLDPAALALHLCGAGARPVATLPLAGETLASGLAFLRGELGHRGVASEPFELPVHPPDFPAHPLARGARFPAGLAAERAELAALYAASAEALRQAARPGASPARLWPHHFDLACTVRSGEAAVGLGFSPGDGPAGEPYWYATLPRPQGALPPLEGRGRWHLEGWFGAELPIDLLAGEASSRRAQVLAFWDSARRAV